MIYLNDDFSGGETNFYALEVPYLSVKPVSGMVLVFVHHKLHEGAAVVRGRKYVQRTDVMFRRVATEG
jgi:prolyl 4-hydroxylase